MKKVKRLKVSNKLNKKMSNVNNESVKIEYQKVKKIIETLDQKNECKNC